MTVHCPHCGQPNLIAGYYERTPRKGHYIEGEERIILYCGHCGKQFTPVSKENSNEVA